ncbi:MAG: hypothetical protein GC151_04835 [Betaproteobacteria bacterium]|nr:hypothetical protein [Betaproteobacteria bacterium]
MRLREFWKWPAVFVALLGLSSGMSVRAADPWEQGAVPDRDGGSTSVRGAPADASAAATLELLSGIARECGRPAAQSRLAATRARILADEVERIAARLADTTSAPWPVGPATIAELAVAAESLRSPRKVLRSSGARELVRVVRTLSPSHVVRETVPDDTAATDRPSNDTPTDV